MSISLHIAKVYDIQYADTTAANGSMDVDDLIEFLEENAGADVSEDRNTIEISRKSLERLVDDEVHGEAIRKMLRESDQRKPYIHLEVF